MRLSEKIVYENMISNLQLSLERLNKLSQKVITGKDVNKPSDSPDKIGKIIDIKNSIQNIEQYSKNILETEKFLDASENALSDIIEILNQAKKIAIQGANATLTGEERQILAKDINNKLKELVSITNMKIDDRYIFSGFKTITQPFLVFENNGEIIDVVYNGDSGLMPEEINNNEIINKNVPGNEFKNQSFDIFKILIDLRENLKNDYIQGIVNIISDIENAYNKILEIRTDIGNKMKRLENTENRLSGIKNTFYKIQSKLEDVDMPEVISNFQLQQNIYQTAIASISKILQQTTLADILK